jgi:transcriptional regulator with XRE-family HTH domain
MDEKERREALAAFLRTRRARLQPAEVGLPARNRRRTPGLRREEVAELANIGVSWYTLLEQGQDVHPSRQVLSSLSQALRLTATEERHLFLLASGEGSGKKMAEEEPIPPALQRVVDALDPHPAYLIGRCWNVLTWNRAAELVFRLHEPCPPHSNNIVWRFFQSETRTFCQEWEKQAQTLVALFRADYARYPGDASFREIIEDLRQASSQFCQWWELQQTHVSHDGPQVIQHPTLGRLEFDFVTFHPSHFPDFRVKLYPASRAFASTLEQALSASIPGT